jgi:hypothetical protein
MTTDDKAFVTTEDRCSSCGAKLTNAETARLTYQGETHKLGEELERVKREHSATFRCFKCGDGNTPLYCMNCANDAELDRVKKELDEALAKSKELTVSGLIVRCGELQARAEAAEAKLTKAEACCGEMRHALLEIKVRIAYIGMPQEPFWTTDDGHKVWDWRKQIALLEHALHSNDCGTSHLSPQQVRELVGPVIATLIHSADVHWGLHSAKGSVHDLANKRCRAEADRLNSALETLTKGTL